MRTVLSLVCGVAFTTNVCAMSGLEAYYQGDFARAASLLKAKPNLTSLEEYYMGRMYLYGYGILKSNTLATQSFKHAAEKGSVPAQLLLAKIELFKNNNPEQALVWFKKAAKANNLSAQMYCAAAYLYGVGTSKNLDTAREYYTAAAKGNNSIAQQSLAADFLKEKQASNRKIGLNWLNKAVEARDPEAELLMAELCRKGDLVARNQDQATQLLEDAINQEYLPAYYQMGQLKAQQEEPREAMHWYEKAAKLNYTPAQIALAELYLDHKNPNYSLRNGFYWVQKAAVAGSIPAQQAVAAMYKNGEGVTANENLAKEWESKAQQPDPAQLKMSQHKQMAEWLSRGRISRLEDSEYQLPGIYSVWQDKNALQDNIYNQAPQLHLISRSDIYHVNFQMILPNDVPISQYYDAMMASQAATAPSAKLMFPHYAVPTITEDNKESNHDPITIAQRDGYDYINQMTSKTQGDYTRKFKELLSQAVIGDSTAQFDVALMYQQGVGVTQSIEEALKFYHLAAAQNDLPSEYHLGLIYLQGKGVPPDYKLGMEWLTDAAFKGNYYAQYTLASLYENGYQDSNGRQIIAPDKDQALEFYQLAATSYYGPAQYRLAEIMVRQPLKETTVEAFNARHRQIKRLFQGAVDFGVEEAKLPLAFYNASDADETKQAEAFADAQSAAAANSTDAAFLLGMMYDRGIATSADSKRAVYWYEQAVTNPLSAFILGTYAAEGKGMRKNTEKAIDCLQFAASKHFPAANYNLAVLEKRQGGKFLPYLEKAANSGLSQAGLTLADYYLSRDSSSAQLQQARGLYEQFAKQGLQSAQLKLGYLYENGLGVTKDYAQALKWYTAAAEQGQGQAQYLLGRLYQFGLVGTSPDQTLAKQWYAKVKSQYAPAAVAYGFIDEIENDDYQHAFNEYQQAADLGDPIAQYDLALIYEKGKNQAVDMDKAKELYKQAGQHNVIKAMTSLGNIYVLEQNISKALPWLNLAISQNDADAAYQLGWLAEKGLIPHASINQAIQYYETAAAQGQANAILALARLYKTGSSVKKDLDKSARYYERLAKENYPEAQYQLAKVCLSTETKSCTSQEAKAWLLKDEQNGHKNASQLLRLMATQKQQGTVSYIETIPLSLG